MALFNTLMCMVCFCSFSSVNFMFDQEHIITHTHTHIHDGTKLTTGDLVMFVCMASAWGTYHEAQKKEAFQYGHDGSMLGHRLSITCNYFPTILLFELAPCFTVFIFSLCVEGWRLNFGHCSHVYHFARNLGILQILQNFSSGGIAI